MAKYLLIESRDPFESPDTANFAQLAEDLAKDGHVVIFFLVQNGVLPARHGARSGTLASLAGKGIEVLADEFSLQERGIGSIRLIPGVKPTTIDIVIDHLVDGAKALWH